MSGRELRSLLLSLSYDILKGSDDCTFDQLIFERFVLKVWPNMPTPALRKGWVEADSEKDGELSRTEFIKWLTTAQRSYQPNKIAQRSNQPSKKFRDDISCQSTEASDDETQDGPPLVQARLEVGPPSCVNAAACVFAMWDRDGNGKICYDEVLETCKNRSSTSAKRLSELFKAMDFNGDGHVSYDEFLRFLVPPAPDA